MKHGFTGVVQKPKRGAIGQIEAFTQCISRLLPESKQIQPKDVWQLFRSHRQQHMYQLGHDQDELQIDRQEHEAAPGFDDDDDIYLNLLN